jgi:hypothetical protein
MSSLILVDICPVTTLADGTAHKEAVGTTLDQAVPYVVTGAGWSTSVTVIKGGTREAEITVSFFTRRSAAKSASQIFSLAKAARLVACAGSTNKRKRSKINDDFAHVNGF